MIIEFVSHNQRISTIIDNVIDLRFPKNQHKYGMYSLFHEINGPIALIGERHTSDLFEENILQYFVPGDMLIYGDVQHIIQAGHCYSHKEEEQKAMTKFRLTDDTQVKTSVDGYLLDNISWIELSLKEGSRLIAFKDADCHIMTDLGKTFKSIKLSD